MHISSNIANGPKSNN